MADPYFFSDTDDSAVEELISQAHELCVLEQVSAINCSGFTDSVLPNDLESRFSRLKSFPVTAKPNSKTLTSSISHNSDFLPKNKLESSYKGSKAESDTFYDDERPNPVEEMDLKPNQPSRVLKNYKERKKEVKAKAMADSSPSDSSDSATEIVDLSPVKKNADIKKRSKSKLHSESFASLGSSKSWTDSPSPPRKYGCFWCSPKKPSSSRKNKENRIGRSNLDWDMDDEFLSDLSVLSTKKQQKILKQAMKEEEKINKEAEKIVKLAKQASQRMKSFRTED